MSTVADQVTVCDTLSIVIVEIEPVPVLKA